MGSRIARRNPPPTILASLFFFLTSALCSAPAIGQPSLRSSGPVFVENQGQWEIPASYVAHLGATAVAIDTQGWTLALNERVADAAPAIRTTSLRMEFVGAAQASICPEQRLPSVHSYFLSNDPRRWRSTVPLHAAVRLHGLYEGVDVLARGQDGHFEYDLLLSPGARLEDVRVMVSGAARIYVEPGGTLVMETLLGRVRQPPPKTWQVVRGGAREPVACRYKVLDDTSFGFRAPDWNTDLQLVVDPGIVWSSLLGDTSYDVIHGVALHPSGVVVTGETISANFPTTPGALSTTYVNPSPRHAFVSLLDPTGSTLIASTFLGGVSAGNGSVGREVLVNTAGEVFVVGNTYSANFPTTPGAFSGLFPGGPGCFPFGVCSSLFVSRLDAGLSTLIASTYLGGAGQETLGAATLTASGSVVIAGTTEAANFPSTPGAYALAFNQGAAAPPGILRSDAFVTMMPASLGSLQWSTFIGGTGAERGGGVAVLPTGDVAVGGSTMGLGFPTVGPAAPALGGNEDAFVVVFDPTGTNLLYSTLIGGSAGEEIRCVAAHPAGGFVLGGPTQSGDFPTTLGAFDTSFSGFTDVFVCHLDPAGVTLPLWSTFMGGFAREDLDDLSVDSSGAVALLGWTESPNFPTTQGAIANMPGNAWDVFVSRLDPFGARLAYSTYLGGWGDDWPGGLAAHPSGDVIVAGATESGNFPTTPGAYATTAYNPGGQFGFASDGFITRMDLLPTGVSRFGTATPACAGGTFASLIGFPASSPYYLALTCTGAPPNSQGLVVIGSSPNTAGTVAAGISIHVDFASPWTSIPVFSDPSGYSETPTTIPPGLTGQTFAVQYGWDNTAACGGGVGTLSASNALLVVVQ